MVNPWRRIAVLPGTERRRGTHERWAEGILLALLGLLAVLRVWPSAPPEPPPAATGLLHRVDLNRAGWHEFVDLPGIGEARAMEIVRDRRANGPFGSVEELARVPGIGPATVSGIADLGFVAGEDR